MSVDDGDVWDRAAGGDPEAFGVVFDLHVARVHRHLGRLLSSPQDIEDAVAIVFLEAWRRRSAVRVVDGSPLPWLLVTATNVANNVRRSGRRYQALLDRLPSVDLAQPAVAVTDEPAVVSALRLLSLEDRQVLTLCVLEEWSEREAAAALRIRPGTVKSRLHRAKHRLADRLGALTSASFEGIGHGV